MTQFFKKSLNVCRHFTSFRTTGIRQLFIFVPCIHGIYAKIMKLQLRLRNKLLPISMKNTTQLSCHELLPVIFISRFCNRSEVFVVNPLRLRDHFLSCHDIERKNKSTNHVFDEFCIIQDLPLSSQSIFPF